MGKFEKEFRVTTSDADHNGNLKASSMFNYFQDIASLHADTMDFGFKDLEENNNFWVLSRFRMDIVRIPVWKEVLKVRTWPKGIHKLFALRDFEIEGADGEIIAKAVSNWLIVNIETRRPQRTDKFFSEHSTKFLRENAIEELPEKIELKGEMDIFGKFKLHYSDLDLNKHTNSGKYLEKCFDAFYEKCDENVAYKSFRINFLYESKPGDELEISSYNDKINHEFFVRGMKNGETVCFTARILY